MLPIFAERSAATNCSGDIVMDSFNGVTFALTMTKNNGLVINVYHPDIAASSISDFACIQQNDVS